MSWLIRGSLHKHKGPSSIPEPTLKQNKKQREKLGVRNTQRMTASSTNSAPLHMRETRSSAVTLHATELQRHQELAS